MKLGNLKTLDVAIAEKAMGQRYVKECPLDVPDCGGKYDPTVGRWPCLPPYSTYIEAAWELVKRYRLCVVPFGESQWTAFRQGRWEQDAARFATDTAEVSICLAALDAAGWIMEECLSCNDPHCYGWRVAPADAH